MLHQGRRYGNTLSAALRECWDEVSMKSATNSNRRYATDPHVCLSGAMSPGVSVTNARAVISQVPLQRHVLVHEPSPSTGNVILASPSAATGPGTRIA